MAVTEPTATEFKARHPRFASVSDDTVTAYLDEAFRSVNDCWNEADAKSGTMYLAAHLMVMEGALNPTGNAPGIGNQITHVKAGEVETDFSTDTIPPGISGQLWATYGSTIYGRRYLDLAARNGGQSEAAVLVV
jgi:hypothetical protein